MADQFVDPGTGHPPGRRRRVGLLFALFPIVVGAVWLAAWPPVVDRAWITENGRYVLTATYLGWDPPQWEMQRLDLLHGDTLKMPRLCESEPYFLTTDGHWLDYTVRQGHIESLVLIRLSDFRETSIPSEPGLWPTVPQMVAENRMAGIDQQGDLIIVQLETNTRQRLTLPATNDFRIPLALGRPDRILVHERNSTRKTGKAFLVSMGETIEMLARRNLNEQMWGQTSDAIYLFNADTDTLQILSLEDGHLLEDYSLAPLRKRLPQASLGMFVPSQSTLLVWDDGNSSNAPPRYHLYDFAKQEFSGTLPIDYRVFDITQDESQLIVTSGADGLGVFDMKTRQTRLLGEQASGVHLAKLSGDDQQLIVARRDGSVRVYNLATGRIERTYRSRAAVPVVFGLVMSGFAAWCVCWVRAGADRKVHPWFDAILINVLLLAAFVVRVNLSGTMTVPSRLAHQMAEGLMASWLVLIMAWVIFGRTRWTVRLLSPILAFAITLTVVLLNFRGGHYAIWQMVVGGFIVAVLSGTWFWLLRRRGHTAIRQGAEPIAPIGNRSNYQLRDLFFLIVAMAVLCAVVRFVSPHMLELREAGEIAIVVTTASLTGCAALWSALGGGKSHWRAMLLVLLVLLNGSAQLAAFPTMRDWSTWGYTLKYQACIAMFTVGTALIYRAHGWRLQRSG